ncbi:hypothetical protein C2W62_21820 [Candidatus Entotheonella serta]|nr:hypothetical protein C2W62_21820 [Candidatus Entotheonella serta]
MGFAPAQRRVPALVLPIHGVGGIVVNHQIRPDTPRRGRDGHVVKYETPFDSRMMLDVPPCVRHHLDNPQVPLFVTEGLKKGDALAGRSTEEVPFGVVPLVGVWNWRGTNEHGGKAPVPCWYSVALNDRLVYIVFDGDVMVKRQVWYALAALKPFLASRGAKIRLVYLPQTLDGQKCGVDDYLVAGHTIQDLRELSTTKLLPPPPLLDVPVSPRVPYAATEHGLVMHRHTPNGVFTVPLANFAATIVTDLIEDDGVERTRTFEIEVTLQQQTTRLMVPAASFAHLTWVTAQLGAGAIIAPGNTMKDHCRAAIQTLSTALTTRTVYTHCGWRQIGEAWCYLHGAGAIGPQEVVANIDVSLGETMARYRLPVPPRVGGERQAIRASLGLLDVAADAVAMPLLMTVWRAVLGAADFALSLVGPTGTGKSELAALAQQHFGAGMDARHLPGAWSSTANALGELLFLAKDALLTIDDYCPTGSQADQQRLHRDADRIFRSQGNTAGRQRMRPQGGLHPERPPRGLILATGEDVPSGQSLRARLLTLEINARTVNWRALSQCQQHAAEGRYAAAMAGFVSWLTSHYDQIRTAWPHVVTELRRQVQDHGHKRHSTITAELQCAWHLFLDYAIQVNAITEEEAVAYRRRSREALTTVAEAQAAYQRDDDPVDRLIAIRTISPLTRPITMAGSESAKPLRRGFRKPRRTIRARRIRHGSPKAHAWAGSMRHVCTSHLSPLIPRWLSWPAGRHRSLG